MLLSPAAGWTVWSHLLSWAKAKLVSQLTTNTLNMPTLCHLCTIKLSLLSQRHQFSLTLHYSPERLSRLGAFLPHFLRTTRFFRRRESTELFILGLDGKKMIISSFLVLGFLYENMHAAHKKLFWSPLCSSKVTVFESWSWSAHHPQITLLSRKFNSPCD